MSEVRRWYIGVYGGEAQARGCTPHTREIIRDSEREIFVLDADFERVDAERDALQALLTAADERADALEGLLRTSLVAMTRIYSAGRDFIVGAGSDCDSVELMMENDPTAREIRAALEPAEPARDEHVCTGCGSKGWTANCAGCVPY